MRDYMDYLASRVSDCSLMFRDSRDRLIAVLPGNLEGSTYFSHARLTYGGLITGSTVRLPSIIRALDQCMTWLFARNVTSVVYKTVPHIYHRSPAEEDRHAMFLLGAKWIRSGMLAVINQANRGEYHERRRRAIKKAKNNGLAVRVSTDLASYWEIVTALLQERYQTKPVHSLEEIELLHRLFPNNIRLHACFHGNTMVAGILAYVSDLVARAQYIASTTAGRNAGAVDLIIDDLITKAYVSHRYIDLGTSEEQEPGTINLGLIDHKEGFGAHSVALDQYRVDLSEWKPGTLTHSLR
jgi:hypothetical protein